MKKVLILLFFINSLYGDILEEKIKNIIGQKKYTIHQKLIENSFKNRKLYSNGNQINYVKVLEVLKNEGLLQLQLNEPSKIHIDFKFIGSKFQSLKNVKEIMASLGYNYFKAHTIEDNNESYIYSIEYKSEFLLDSAMFADELNSIDAKIIDINHSDTNNWTYVIDFSNASVYGAKKITNNEKIKLTKPLKPYLLEIEGGKKLIVISHQLNKWYPKIAFFDKNLNYINSVEKTRMYKGVKTTIPQNTRYIQIGDSYSLINIKRGIKVIVKD